MGKTDFDYRIRIEESPSVELRDWLKNDVILTLWESKPKFAMVKEDGMDAPAEKVVLDPATRTPIIEVVKRGVSKLNLIKWLKVSPLNPTYDSSMNK
jgi:hypothetical protein